MEEEREFGQGNPAPSAAQRAYGYVKERLLDGRLAGGSLLSENELARRLGVSRTPVRQAFLQLEGEDLLTLYPRRGALVRPVSASEADDVLEARLLIEVHCVARVAAAGVDVSADLCDAIAAQERSLEQGGAGFTVADRQFHRAIVAANHNDILTRQYDGLRDRQQRISAAAALGPGRIARFIEEHSEIAEAIAAREPERVADLVGAHLRRAHELARRPLP